MCVWVGGGGGWGREREWRQRERELVVYGKVWGFIFFLTYFVSWNGPCAPKEQWHRKEHIIIIIIVIINPLILSTCQLNRPGHLRTNHAFKVLSYQCKTQVITNGLFVWFTVNIRITRVLKPIYISPALSTGTCISHLLQRSGWSILLRWSKQKSALASPNASPERSHSK